MSNQITLEILKKFYPNDESIVESIGHNLHFYLKHMTSKEICKKNIVNFDMRKDYWNYFEMVVLIKYSTDIFYKRHLKPKMIRSCLYEIFDTFKRERLNGRFDKMTVGFGALLKNKENVILFLDEIIEIAKNSNWKLDRDVLQDLGIEEDNLSSNFIHYIEEIKKLSNETDDFSFLASVTLIKKIPYFAYITAKNQNEIEDHLIFFNAWYTLLTSTNAYGAGAQAFGPIIGNSNTASLLDYIFLWSNGKSINEVPFEALNSRSSVKEDFSHIMTVTELYGFCRLEKQPFINNAVIESYHSLVGVSDSIDEVAMNVSRWFDAKNKQDNDFESTLLIEWDKIRKNLNNLEFSNVTIEGIEGKKLSKKYEHDFEDLIDKKYEKLANELAQKLIAETVETTKIKIVKNLLIDAYFRNNLSRNENIAELNEKDIKVKGKNKEMFKNTILFGPPGTGKTYNSVNKAVAIANPEFDQSLGREAVKAEYDRLVKDERIVFTTFHQSMSYEDFIEGIKPVEPDKDGDPLNYKIELGIFRKLCIEASFEVAQSKNIRNTKKILDFSIIYDKFIDDVESKIGKKEKIELKIKAGGTVLLESISSQSNILVKHHGGDRIYTVSKSRLAKLYAAIPDLNAVDNINNKFREIIGGSNSSAYWAVLNAIRESHFTFDSKDSNRSLTFDEKKEVVSDLTMADYKNTTAKPYVLIIDEINRGNVAQIFGELITLIEDSKRLGQEEAIEAVLPYSKEKFGVPDNLFIVGTMNTADRSVEALDTALRRRFSFEEMSPNPEELEKIIFNNEEIDLVGLLKTINKRIEKLLNKDHLIGHSFFLDVKNISDLKTVFGNKIIPLLQEYFYGDFGKIGLVLGSLFVNVDNSTPNDFFAKFDNYDAEDLSGKPIYTIFDVKKMDDKKFKLAVDSILRK